jgi:hypothetical protein
MVAKAVTVVAFNFGRIHVEGLKPTGIRPEA